MKMITVWGSSGAGKSTLSLGIATELAARHNDVLLISTCGRTPALPVFLPTEKNITGQNSIGPLLVSKDITEGSLKDKIIKHPNSKRIFFMGYASGEATVLTYGQPQQESVSKLIHLLNDVTPFEYCIVDCDSKAEFDPLTTYAIENADFGISVVTPDVKGYEFYKAMSGWLANSDSFHIENFTRIANLIYKHTPLSAAEDLFGGFAYKIPWARQVSEKFSSGELLSSFNTRDGNEFSRVMRLLCDDIEEVTNNGE